MRPAKRDGVVVLPEESSSSRHSESRISPGKFQRWPKTSALNCAKDARELEMVERLLRCIIGNADRSSDCRPEAANVCGSIAYHSGAPPM